MFYIKVSPGHFEFDAMCFPTVGWDVPEGSSTTLFTHERRGVKCHVKVDVDHNELYIAEINAVGPHGKAKIKIEGGSEIYDDDTERGLLEMADGFIKMFS